MDIIIICASHNKNLKLSKYIENEIKKESLNTELIDLTQINLPLYTSRLKDDSAIEIAEKYKEQLKSAKGFIFVAPEYNGSIPPVLSNFIAWISVCNKNWREAFNEKPAVIATHSGSGGLHCLMALRSQLSYIGLNVIGRQIHTHFKKEINKESVINVIQQIKSNL